MITVTKRGKVYLNSESGRLVVCNRPGIVVEYVKEFQTTICVNKNIQNAYTISHASQGTLVSFFSIDRNFISDDIIDQAWFIDFRKAYFLCTLTQLDGYLNHIGTNEIGNLIFNNLNESYFQQLDPTFAYTFSVNCRGLLKIVYIWDIKDQKYISPLSSKWKIPQFCKVNDFIVKKNGIEDKLTKSQLKQPLIECCDGIKLIHDQPLVITIYCGNIVYSIRLLTKLDSRINKMRNSAPGKFEALLLARLKGDDTFYFERKHFTDKELKSFEMRIEKGVEKFKDEIYQKAALKQWVCFPDKIYNTIRLGDIIDSELSVTEKQDKAIVAIKDCTKGWKKKALFDFYQNYCASF